MTKKEFAKEVGMVAAIVSDSIFEKLYAVCQRNGTGYITAVETISEWSLEFVIKHEKTNWEEVLQKGISPLSKQISEIICWDDASMDWAYFKLEQLDK